MDNSYHSQDYHEDDYGPDFTVYDDDVYKSITGTLINFGGPAETPECWGLEFQLD